MDPKQTAANYADQMGVGPKDSSTIDKGQDLISQGIETVQNSVFGQKNVQAEKLENKQTPHMPEVDNAHPASVEEMMREKHKSEPVGNVGNKQ